MTETKPTGMTIPPSAEYMLPIVRNRLCALEEAVEAFLSVMETTGKEREAAYTKQRDGAPVEWVANVSAFLNIYERTMSVRLEAFQKLREAMTMDFETALLCAPDTTDEHLAKWLPQLQEQSDGE